METKSKYLEIQDFLKGFQSIDLANSQLALKYDINVTKSFLLPSGGMSMETVWIYNYDMIKARGDLNIENEARALILDQNADIVSMSFKRFFNAHEQYASKIDWDSAIAEFKHDGSLIVIYEHKGRFYIQTRKTPTANGVIHNSTTNMTYEEAVINILKEKFNNPFKPFRDTNEDERLCWVFEFVSPVNRIVTPYKNADLKLLTIFDKLSVSEIGREAVNEFAKRYNLSRTSAVSINSIDEVIEVFPSIDPLEEGFVVVDKNFNRIKIKNPSYLAIARTINAGNKITPEHFANIVLKGDANEIASYYPEYSDALFLMQSILEEMVDEVASLWILNNDKESRKEFALAVKDHPLSGILFMMWTNKIERISDGFHLIKPEHLVLTTANRRPSKFKKVMEKFS